MKAEIKDVIGLYIGCNLHDTDGFKEDLQLVGYTQYESMVQVKYGNGMEEETDWWNIETVKPILRSLEDITEEDRAELDNILNAIDINSYSDVLIVEANKTALLLSKHYDLFNLIETNQAIKK